MSDRRSQAAAQAMADRVFGRLRGVRSLPLSAPPWQPAQDDSFRRLVVDDYVLIYRVDVAREALFVLSLRHVRQRPAEPESL